MMERFFADIRYALRGLRKSAAFTVVVVLMLALGIGANTAMFTVIRGVLLKPLSYPDSERLVELTGEASIIRFEEARSAQKSYTDISVYLSRLEDVTLTGGGAEPEVLKQARVSHNFLDVLGVRPVIGRAFRAEEDAEGGPAVAMISTSLWHRRFASDPNILNRTANLGGTPHSIVAVLPDDFKFPASAAQVWVPRPTEVALVQPQSRRISPLLTLFGRLKPGVSLAQANAEYKVLRRQFAAAHPEMLDARPDPGARVVSMRDQMVFNVRTLLWMLFGAVGFVLLIACANMASLLLARSNARSREFAVRAALGAGRGRLIVQLLTESLPLAFLGGALGAGLASIGLNAMARMAALNLPRLDQTRLDGTVLAFALGLSLFTGVLFGIAPAVSASRPDLANALRAAGASGQPNPRHWFAWLNLRSALVVGQVALSIVLLIGAGLLIGSLRKLYDIDLGFRSDHLLTMQIPLSPAQYDTVPKRAAFFADLVERLNALSGVRGSATTLTLPLGGFIGTPVQDASQPILKLNERKIATIESITAGFFEVMQIPLKRGRNFDRRDQSTAPPVAIISESLARTIWPQYPGGPDPVGRHLYIGIAPRPIEVIGIVADVRQARETDAWPGLYRPASQGPPLAAALVVRTSGDPMTYRRAVEAQIYAMNPNQPVFEVKTMEQVAETEIGQRRLVLMLLGAFSATALLLTLIGLYGVIAYSVAQRTAEIGIRRALGATPGNILRLLMGQGLGLTLAGIVLGIGGALSLTQAVSGLLYRVSATDPYIYAVTAVLFLVVALAASYMPARRAAHADPSAALRTS